MLLTYFLWYKIKCREWQNRENNKTIACWDMLCGTQKIIIRGSFRKLGGKIRCKIENNNVTPLQDFIGEVLSLNID